MVFIIAGIFTFLLSPLYVFAQVEADVATAKEIQALHEADIMALPGVIGIGIGSREEGGMEFVVLVDKDAPMPDLPSNLEGIPVVAEKISKIVIHNGGNGCDPCHNEKLPMPVPAVIGQHQKPFAVPVESARRINSRHGNKIF